LFDWFGIDDKWCFQTIPSGYQLAETDILFERIDKAVAAAEKERLGL